MNEFNGSRIDRIVHTFKQEYGGWNEGAKFYDHLTIRSNCFDIIEAIDILENVIESDDDYHLAKKMLQDIGIHISNNP